MWTYLVRRILIMIPTLFGVTLISFCVMQLAPGDPAMDRLGGGAAGQSTQTRDAYLIQKRDLKLDKPLVLNLRYFRDYTEEMRIAAYYMGRFGEEIEADLPALANPRDSAARARRDFLRGIMIRKIKDFDQRLEDPEQRPRLALAIVSFVRIFCEDLGSNGVTATMALLDSEVDQKVKIGAVRALNVMVVEPHKYTYSQHPTDVETPRVMKTWQTWRQQQEEETLEQVARERQLALESAFSELVGETDRSEIFARLKKIQREVRLSPKDRRFFIDKLLGDASLQERVVASLIMSKIASPLTMDVPLDAEEDRVKEAAENWRAHYGPRLEDYEPPLATRVVRMFIDTQYAHMVWRLMTFNFGRSALKTRDLVADKIWDAVKVSAPLMLLSGLLTYLVAVPIGVVCAVNRGKTLDRLLSLGLFLLYSVPAFVAGMLFLLFLCYGDYLKIFPMDQLHSDGAEDFGFIRYTLDYLWHITLPVTCLSLFSLAGLAMYSRSSMLDVIGQDYIRTARAKGLSHGKVILKHALRNALIPIITLFSNLLPAMLGGSVLIEYLFGIPGMGRVSWESIELKDFPTLMALIYIDAIVVMISFLLSDLTYVLADPRISFEGQGKAT